LPRIHNPDLYDDGGNLYVKARLSSGDYELDNHTHYPTIIVSVNGQAENPETMTVSGNSPDFVLRYGGTTPYDPTDKVEVQIEATLIKTRSASMESNERVFEDLPDRP
jgi:hypothetical protein